MLTFALAGNQNCGKTTLFNQLTGSNQHVGNFPGVTVDRKDGQIRGQEQYAGNGSAGYLFHVTLFQRRGRDEKLSCWRNIQKESSISWMRQISRRNLYLTMQLMELDIPMVLALNMMDEVRENGGSILVNQMEELLGIPVVPISAAKE